ncbi:gustatory receptor 2a, partial [Asbolus verrucosus]
MEWYQIEKKMKQIFKWKSYKNVKIFIICEILFNISIWVYVIFYNLCYNTMHKYTLEISEKMDDIFKHESKNDTALCEMEKVYNAVLVACKEVQLIFSVSLLIQFAMFLMCPRPVDEKIKNEDKSIFAKLFLYIYNILSIGVIIYFIVETSNYNISPDINIFIQLATLLFNVVNNISMLATVLFYLYYQNKFTEIVCRLYKIETKFKKLFKWKSYKNVKIFIVSELLFVIILWISFFINYIGQCETVILKCVKNWIVLYTSTKMSQVMLVEFCTFVIILRQKLTIINENIKELFTEKNHDNKSEITEIYYEKTLSEIEKIYNEIITACTEVQSIFSVPLLMKIASQFVSVFSALYFAVFGYLADGHLVTPKGIKDVVLSLIIIFICAVEILTTIAVCELTVLEYKRTGKLIYRTSLAKNNVMLMKRINLFSLQLLHKDFDFHASGFFKINGSLLQT